MGQDGNRVVERRGGVAVTPREIRQRRWLRSILSLLVAVLAALTVTLGVTTASASAAGVAETRVEAISLSVEPFVGPPQHVSAGQRLGSAENPGQVVVATGVAAKAGSSKVNPLGGTQNCVNCAIAGDHTLAGFPTSALDSAGPQLISRIEQHFGASFKAVGGRSDISDILANAGPGARGIVFGARGSDPGHVFNAINQGGVVRYIDFQTGHAASFNGYSGFSFLRTN